MILFFTSEQSSQGGSNMKQKKKLFARGTFSYRVLWISIIYLFLFASVIAPITKIEGENRSTFILISIAIILILALLIYAFRNVKSIFYIALAIGFGWIFAIGLMGAVHDRISIIVLGIGSVIIGIAVNYPLHFVAHLKHYPDVRATLKELIAPLVIGNITTVGAFLALVPLNSVALRDLGLFASFMLVGTILFVIVVLPQMVKSSREAAVEPKMAFARLSKARVERRRGRLRK